MGEALGCREGGAGIDHGRPVAERLRDPDERDRHVLGPDDDKLRPRRDRLDEQLGKLDVDLVAGGPPCQPFSRAGRSKLRSLVEDGSRDSHDERAELWRAFLRVVEGVRPRAVLMENVPDMALGDDFAVLRVIVERLESAGYDVQTRIIEANAYKTAEEIRGEGDAQAAAIYAAAYNQDPEFYEFYRSINAYSNVFQDKGDMLVLDPNSQFFKYLKGNTGDGGP